MIDARPILPLSPTVAGFWRRRAEARGARRAARRELATRASSLAVALVSVVTLAVVSAGWLLRDRMPLTPKHGLGYALGITGGSVLLLLALYPLRKHLSFMRGWGVLAHWFRVHMFLGVVAPVLILFHCNFRVGAPNSNVALLSMLVVAASGVVGRYIYTRISHGLYGARTSLAELQARLEVRAQALGDRLPPASRTTQRLAAFAAWASGSQQGIGARGLRFLALPCAAMWVRRQARRDLRWDIDGEAARLGWDARTRRAHEQTGRVLIGAYVGALVKEIQFSAWARLFSLWHALHVPLFVMLILTGILHVVAVHMY